MVWWLLIEDFKRTPKSRLPYHESPESLHCQSVNNLLPPKKASFVSRVVGMLSVLSHLQFQIPYYIHCSVQQWLGLAIPSDVVPCEVIVFWHARIVVNGQLALGRLEGLEIRESGRQYDDHNIYQPNLPWLPG